MEGREKLAQLNDHVTAVEQRHNEVLDHLETTSSDTRAYARALREQMGVLEEEMRALKEAINDRLGKAKSAAVLLSLIAQEEELTPLQNRIDKQPYELYEESEAFKRRLEGIK